MKWLKIVYLALIPTTLWAQERIFYNSNLPMEMPRGETTQVEVSYVATGPREIQYKFVKNVDGWATYFDETQSVSAGEGSVFFNVPLDASTPLNNEGCAHQALLLDRGSRLRSAWTKKVSIIEGSATIYTDGLATIAGPSTITQGDLISVSVNYEAAADRTIIVRLQRNTTPPTYYGEGTASVSAGGSMTTINLIVDAGAPAPANNYSYVARMVNQGNSWDNTQVTTAISQPNIAVEESASSGPSTENIIHSISGPTRVTSGGETNVGVTIIYEATGSQDMLLCLKNSSDTSLNYAWLNPIDVELTYGPTTNTYLLNVWSSILDEENAYKWLTVLYRDGGSYWIAADIHDQKEQRNVSCGTSVSTPTGTVSINGPDPIHPLETITVPVTYTASETLNLELRLTGNAGTPIHASNSVSVNGSGTTNIELILPDLSTANSYQYQAALLIPGESWENNNRVAEEMRPNIGCEAPPHTDPIFTYRLDKYSEAMPNPLKGFQNDINDSPLNEYATLVYDELEWSQLERTVYDDAAYIKSVCSNEWSSLKDKGLRVIPRVIIQEWGGSPEHLPSDLTTSIDYSNPIFQQRLVDFITELGKAWDNDPRIAWIQMGIVGDNGSYYPAPSNDLVIQELLGTAFANAFKNKKVLVRHAQRFETFAFGTHWDAWAHSQASWETNNLYSSTRWLSAPIEGRVNFDWPGDVNLGSNPTTTLSTPSTLDYLLDSIYDLHCSGLNRLDDYDDNIVSTEADEIQQAFGYRFVIDEVSFDKRVDHGNNLNVTFTVQNQGSAPFYYNWPVELHLLNTSDLTSVLSTNINVDVRDWLPGTDWNGVAYQTAAPINTVNASLHIPATLNAGEYFIALTINDPVGGTPAVLFANMNYFGLGYHPIGRMGVQTDVAGGNFAIDSDGYTFADRLNEGPLPYILPADDTPVTQPPTITLTAPTALEYSEGTVITFSANATDPDGGNVTVDFYADGTLLGTDSTSPYTITYSLLTPGTYNVWAQARDNEGATENTSGQSLTITENINNDIGKYEVIPESWTSDIAFDWIPVSFENSFANPPIIIASPVSDNGTQPGHVRIRNVTTTGFEYTVEEWAYLDGAHGADETIFFHIMGEGTHVIGGKTWVAGTATVGSSFTSVSFGHNFGEVPAVFGQVVSHNDTVPVVLRMRNTTSTSVDMKLQEEETQADNHAPETIHYIAVAKGSGNDGTLFYESGTTPQNVTEADHTITFENSYQDPLFFAQLSSYYDSDPAGLRYRDIAANAATVFAEEEDSAGDGTSRTSAETVSWMVLADGLLQSIGDWVAPCDIERSNDGNTLYFLGAKSKQLFIYDRIGASVSKTITLPDTPSGMVLSDDGNTLFITGGEENGVVWRVRNDTLYGSALAVGHTPMAPKYFKNGGTERLYVCNRFNNNVSVINAATWSVIRAIDVVREPVAADISPNRGWLTVANQLQNGTANSQTVAAEVSIINLNESNLNTHTNANNIQLLNGSGSLRGIKFAPEGDKIYVTHMLGRITTPNSQLERGWQNNGALSIIEMNGGSPFLEATVLLDGVDRGFSNPSAMDFMGNNDRYLVIASSASQQIMLLDRISMATRIENAYNASGSDPQLAREIMHRDLTFLHRICRRIKLNEQSNGPRALTIVSPHIYVANYFSDTIDQITPELTVHTFDYKYDDNKNIQWRQGTQNPLAMSRVRRGEMYYNNASQCFQTWQSCTSCHPDARSDAFNWDLLNDGMGSLKNAKSHLFSTKTAPAMWTGVRDNTFVAAGAGLQHIQFMNTNDVSFGIIQGDIVHYLSNLTAVASPTEWSTLAQDGLEVFNNHCTGCHPASSYFTDGKLHNGIDTPGLNEAWRTAPYFHNGSAATLEDAINGHHNSLNRNSIDFKRLVEYVRTL